MYDYQMFRTVRMKGFDRDEVIAYIQSKDEEFSRKTADFEKTIAEKDRMIEELKGRLVLKDAQRVALENEIETKYKKYIDNYDKIGALVYESQIKGDQMIADAKEQADKMVGDATRESDRLVGDATATANQLVSDATEKANKLVGDAQAEADRLVGTATEEAARIRSTANEEARVTRATASAEVEQELSEGKRKYSQIQMILNDTVDLINQVQKRFMSSYKDVHDLVAEITSDKALADQVDNKPSGRIVFDEADDFDDENEDVNFETGELNFDLSEALLDSEDEELDEIPAAYRGATDEAEEENLAAAGAAAAAAAVVSEAAAPEAVSEAVEEAAAQEDAPAEEAVPVQEAAPAEEAVPAPVQEAEPAPAQDADPALGFSLPQEAEAVNAEADKAASAIESSFRAGSLTGDISEVSKAIAGPLGEETKAASAEDVAAAVSEASAKAAEETFSEIASEVKPLEKEADVFFRGANV